MFGKGREYDVEWAQICWWMGDKASSDDNCSFGGSLVLWIATMTDEKIGNGLGAQVKCGDKKISKIFEKGCRNLLESVVFGNSKEIAGWKPIAMFRKNEMHVLFWCIAPLYIYVFPPLLKHLYLHKSCFFYLFCSCSAVSAFIQNWLISPHHVD